MLCLASSGLTLLLQSSIGLGFMFLLSGLSCCESSFLVPDASTPALSLSVRSSAWSDVSLAAFDFAELGLCSLLRSHSCSGSLLPASTWCVESLPSVLNLASPGAILLPRSSGCVGSSFPVLDPADVDASASFRAKSNIGLKLFAVSARLGSTILTPSSVSLGPPLPMQSSNRTESQTSVTSAATLGSSLSLRSFARIGLLLFVPAVSVKAFALFVLKFTTLEPLLSVQSFRCCGVMPVADMVKFGFPLLSRSLMQTSLVMLIFGLVWLGISLSTVDSSFDLIMFSRGFAQMSPVLPVVYLAPPGVPLSMHACRLALFLSTAGRGLGKSVVVSDFGHLEVLLLLRSFSHISSLLVLSFAHSDPITPSKTNLCLGESWAVCRVLRVGAVLSAPAVSSFGSAVLLQASS